MTGRKRVAREIAWRSRIRSGGAGRLPTAFDRIDMMETDPIAVKRGRAPEYKALAMDFDRKRRNPCVDRKVRDLILEPTQSVVPDLGRRGHSK